MISRPPPLVAIAAALAVGLSIPLAATTAAQAATTYTPMSLTITVAGTTVTAVAKVSASADTGVSAFGVCARNSNGRNVDFWKRPATITRAGTSSQPDTKSLPAGTYTMWSCLYDTAWRTVGTPRTAIVGNTQTPPTTSPSSTPPATTLTISNITSATATLSWTGTGATSYTVGRDNVDASGSGAWSTVEPAGAGTRIFNNLRPNTTYNLYVEPAGGSRKTLAVVTQATTATPSPSAPATSISPSSPPTTASPTSPTTVKPLGVTGNWQTTFADEFAGTSIDTNKWTVMDGSNMNNVTTSKNNVTVTGGHAALTLSSQTSGAEICTNPYGGSQYTLPVGSFTEARVLFPGDGTKLYNWPAWWASGPNWPSAGEHDIAEVLGGQLTVNYHSPSGSHNQGNIAGSWGNAYHTYGLHRKATSADVYWDGKLVKSYSTDDNGAGQSLIVNVGANGSGVYGASSQVLIDYVRAFKPV